MNHPSHNRRPSAPPRSRSRVSLTGLGSLLAAIFLLTSVVALASDAPPIPPSFLPEQASSPINRVIPDPMWADLGDESAAKNVFPGDREDLPRKFRLLRLDLPTLTDVFDKAPLEEYTNVRDGMEITLPMPDGSFQRFLIVESPMIGPDVQAIIPDFRSYMAKGIDDPTAVLRLDTSGSGFHAFGRTAGGFLWIAPHSQGDTEHVISAWKNDFKASTEGFECGTEELGPAPGIFQEKALALTGDMLHTYRMILTLTGEYCTNFGGTSAATNQAVVTLNRINTIFETDASVRFNVVGVLAYGNPATDPFPNGGSINTTLLQQNQANTDSIYGTGAYDIGHILTGPGQAGLAYYNALCTSIKAQGGTSFTVPYRDDFAVTYWAHELGHQFNARHTFNTSSGQCGNNRAASGAYEPGAGSTIMSYAGACAPENSATVPDPYFHIGSLEAIIAARAAAGCGTITATGNTPPVANAGPDQIIPRDTPFWVNGSAVDPDANTLTYTWEQFDLGAASPPTDPYGPLFRSFSPGTSGARYFPDWGQVFDGSADLFETMPWVDRSLTLRLTVRDNAAGAGGVDDDELELTVSGDPFFVTAPNGGESFVAGHPITVTWNVGGSVASNVVIWMISDAGFSQLIPTTANDGSENVTLPCGITATNCRIWIEELSGTSLGAHVFDVSDADFTLTDGLPDFGPFAYWGDSIVPNSVASTDLPTSLFGDTTSYIAWVYWNFGAAYGCSNFETRTSIDEVAIQNFSTPNAAPPGTGTGWGPIARTVSGGRHTLWQMADPDDIQPESDETNNSYARQWVWQPAELPGQTAAIRSQPPERSAGAAHIPGGVTFYNNVDGLRLNDYGAVWQALAVSSIDGFDYDVSLYDQSNDPNAGFQTSLVSSTFGGNATDFVLVNRALAPSLAFDAGLLRYNGSGDYVADRRYPAGTVPVGGSNLGVSMAQNQIIDLRVIQIDPGEEGRNVVEIDNVSTSQGVDILLYAHDLALGSRGSAIGLASVDGTGSAWIDHDFTAAGYYMLAVVRKASDGLTPFTYDVSMRPTPPDITTAVVAGSHGPVVPQFNSTISLGDPIPAPTVLEGDAGSTIMYFHVANNGPADADLWDFTVNVDGAINSGIEWPFGLPGGTSNITSQAFGGIYFAGGRHTAGMFFDSANEFDELNEDNNRFAEQWVWTPTQVALEGTIGRGTPPDPLGGWDDIPAGLTRELNVDGLRTPAFVVSGDNGYLGGWAATPNPGSDIDLRVHAASTGAQDGFSTLLETSGQAGNATEFVLFDLDGPLPGGVAYDIGAERVSGNTGYQAHATESVYLNYNAGGAPGQDFGPFTLGSGELLGLFEFSTFNEGGLDVPIYISLNNLSGGADLALSVFGRTDASGFISPPEVVTSGFADNGGDGSDESVELTLPGGQYWAIAVYKTNGEETGKTVDFSLRLAQNALVDVPDGKPLVASIANYPNPFNPQTKIEFTLEKPGKASVRIYDVQGRLVRTLVDEDLAAGHHSRDWTGKDKNGSVVASGVYLALFEYPGGAARQRMVLLK
jgi:Metallo-peptidase family M12B Reprolysin-like/FlgD Ig-like domain